MPELEWWKRFARAELRWFAFICDRIVSDAVKNNPLPSIEIIIPSTAIHIQVGHITASKIVANGPVSSMNPYMKNNR